MVKSLKDILKEIENKKPIVSNFANGGYGSDMGQDDTLGEDNEGSITGTEDTSGFTTDDVSYGDRGMHPSELEDITNRAMSEEEAIDFIGDASRGESRVEQMVNRDQQAYNLWGDAAVDNLENIERGLFGQVVPTTLAEAGKKVGTSILSNIAFGGAAPLVGLAYNVVEAIDRFSKESDLDKAVAESDIGKGKGKAAQAEQSLIDNASSLATADQLSMFPGLMMATEKEMADFIGLTKPDTSSGSSRPSWGDPEGYERDKFTTQVAQQLIDPDDSVVTDTLDEPVGVYENLVANLVQNRPSYTGAKSGGSIDAFDRGGDIPSDIFNDPRVRMYLEQFTFGSKPDDITNKNIKNYFTEKELQLLKDIIKRKKGDEGTISYGDYFRIPSEVREKKRGFTPEEEEIYNQDTKETQQLRDTLGGFSFKKNPQTGEIKLSDVYDWGKEYDKMGHTGQEATQGIATGGRNVTGLETIKGLATRDWRDSLEMFANAYGPRETNDNPETQTIVDVLGIRPEPRKISYTYKDKEKDGNVMSYNQGGLAEMMRRRQQLSPNPFQVYQNNIRGYNPYTGRYGGSPNVPYTRPDTTTPRMPPPQRGIFNGFPKLGDQGSKDTQLKPETYFHEHEGGKVNYPNFPSQTGIEPANKRNPIKGITPKPFPQPTPKQYVSEDLPSVTQEIATPLETPVAAEEEAVEQQVTQPTSINIDMPQNVTATLDFPEDVVGTPQYNYKGGNVMRYNNGGLTGLASNNPEQYNIGGFLRSILPAVAGGAAGMTGLGGFSPWLVGGLTGAATGALTGGKKDRNVLGFAKNFLMGGSGASAANIANPNVTPVTSYGQGITEGFKGFGDNIAQTFANPTTTLSDYALPLAGLVGGMSLEQPATGGPRMTPQQMAQMSPEQQEKFLQTQRERFPYQRPTFQPPNTGINFAADGGTVSPNNAVAIRGGEGLSSMGLLPQLLQQVIASRQAQGLPIPFNLPNTDQKDQVELEQVDTFATAADGGVMEIDEEMQSGSFVLPADVVSNVGDGSSTSGHRRLAQLFGGGDDYAIGGGILKGPIKGPGGGLDDLIQTGIDGVRVARLSTDEFVVPKDVVRKIGDGSQKAGAEQLYDFMKNVRLNKHGTSQQPKGINMAGLKKMV